MFRLVFFVIIFVVGSGPRAASNATFMPAGQLKQLCASSSGIDQAVCDGYIMAVNDAMFSGHLGHLFNTCPSAGVSPLKTRQAVLRHMDENPDKLNYVADGIVAEALASAYPCQEKRAKKKKK